VEDVAVTADFWRGRSVFLTGHTGFKGGWLSLWLHALGARVTGYALAPPTDPSLFAVARIARTMAASHVGDVRDLQALAAALKEAAPDVVFHLAAQSQVRPSYADPVGTYSTNIMGTVNLLEAVRGVGGVRAVVNVTSDKCYENREWPHAYRETDAMGGHDPYSSSKGAAELVAAAYHRSFFAAAGPRLASARAGNVIGGGDWATDRLVPDFFRAFDAGTPLLIRSPNSTRPWQHVLEPLAGYLVLAEQLAKSIRNLAGGWNFGPLDDDVCSVGFLADYLTGRVGGNVRIADGPQPHEANVLRLDSGKARAVLGWSPRWRINEALDRTIDWHRAWSAGQDMRAATMAQIASYQASGRS
jgi:CDP-glucose 4,6-dehydratase